MFEQRLKITLLILLIPVLILIARLGQLQILQSAQYQDAAQRMLYQKPRFFPFLRGEIVDRNGIPLAYNAETWELSVHYFAMINDPDDPSRQRVFRQWDRDTSENTLRDIQTSWQTISQLTGVPLNEIDDEVQKCVRRVKRIKASVARSNNVDDMEILEEFQYWPVVRGLDFDQQVEARVQLADYPWIEVIPGQERRYQGGEALGPIIGRLGDVPPQVLDRSHDEDSLLTRYEPNDQMGISGAEALGESTLRGIRGFEHLDKEGQPILDIHDAVEPINGQDMQLSLDLVLQQRIYHRLATAVAAHPSTSTGASAVLIHIPTRQVHALVSYPSYDPNLSWSEILDLADDTKHQPLALRAIGGRFFYPPGSVVKPMVFASALASGVATIHTHFDCMGRMFQDEPNKWRCLGYHPNVDPTTAIKKSCNVFFYHVGQDMTVTGLNHWMDRFGFGKTAGTGLLEENPAHLPSQGTRGIARQMAIGQDGFDVTPLQVANMMADLATGQHEQVVFRIDEPLPRNPQSLGISESHLIFVREAMYRVANEPGGTATKALTNLHHQFPDYAILGKTGSAEPHRFVTSRLYTCKFEDGHTEKLAATSERALRKQHPDIARVTGSRVHQRFPTKENVQDHAWFAGYITERNRYQRTVRDGELNYALAVVVEFAGHGGDAAAPVFADIVHDVMDRQHIPARPPPVQGEHIK